MKAEGGVVSLTGTDIAVSLTNEAVANVIHDMRRDRPGLAGRNSFAVVDEARRRRIAREIFGVRIVYLSAGSRGQTDGVFR